MLLSLLFCKMNSELKTLLEKELSQTLKAPCAISVASPQHGGSINRSYRLSTNQGSFFIKLNQGKAADFFEKEAQGLIAIAATKSFKVPEVIHYGAFNNEAWQYLLLEQIDTGVEQAGFWKDFALQLAALHRHFGKTFGYNEDNYIGSLPQKNSKQQIWSEFFAEQRLLFQTQMAYDDHLIDRQLLKHIEQLCLKLQDVFPVERPSFIHGDLWSGNYLCSRHNEPVLIDPAVHYAHREMDIAMMHLFGGFPKRVFEAYHEVFPLEQGWEKRIDLCNLYPLLVHVNLFGSSYAIRVDHIVKRFL